MCTINVWLVTQSADWLTRHNVRFLSSKTAICCLKVRRKFYFWNATHLSSTPMTRNIQVHTRVWVILGLTISRRGEKIEIKHLSRAMKKLESSSWFVQLQMKFFSQILKCKMLFAVQHKYICNFFTCLSTKWICHYYPKLSVIKNAWFIYSEYLEFLIKSPKLMYFSAYYFVYTSVNLW